MFLQDEVMETLLSELNQSVSRYPFLVIFIYFRCFGFVLFGQFGEIGVRDIRQAYGIAFPRLRYKTRIRNAFGGGRGGSIARKGRVHQDIKCIFYGYKHDIIGYEAKIIIFL